MNNVEFRLVDIHPETGIAFYVNNGHGGVIGVQVLPNGTKRLMNATATTCPNSAYSYNAKRKQRYLQFRDAFGVHKSIIASHAVYIAWCGRPIAPGMTIDHINGCTTDNRFENLRQVSNAVNSRDGAFLRKLKKAGIDPTTVPRWMLLRYFVRMAKVREILPYKAYRDLTKALLRTVLYHPEFNINLFI